MHPDEFEMRRGTGEYPDGLGFFKAPHKLNGPPRSTDSRTPGEDDTGLAGISAAGMPGSPARVR